MAAYVVKTSALGASPTTLGNAVPGTPEWEINAAGRWSFRIPTADAQATTALLGSDGWAREGELYRNGDLIWAGPIISIESDPLWTTCNCEGLLAYFGVRHIDVGADRTNYLTNPQFEDSPDLTGWAATGATASIDTTEHVLGSKSAQLDAGAYDQNWYLEQTYSYTAGAIGAAITVAAWFQIDSTGYLGPAYLNRGLWVFHDGGGPLDLGVVEIDDDTPHDSWQRVETIVWVPPNVTANVEVRLYAPGGTIWWDALSATVMESLSPEKTDEAAIAGMIVDFCQNNLVGFTTPWSDLAIPISITATGTKINRYYQYADHVGALEALMELVGMGRFDLDVKPDRFLRTYPGGKGTDRTSGGGAVTLTLNSNCLLRKLTRDGYQAANSIVALGPGDGPDREEGGARDGSALGGVTVQEVFTPPGTPPIDSLDATASTRLAGKKRPRVLSVAVIDPALTDVLEEGDTVNVSIAHGMGSASGEWRIIKRTLVPTTDLVEVDMNPAV